jgi:hypothetical protein
MAPRISTRPAATPWPTGPSCAASCSTVLTTLRTANSSIDTSGVTPGDLTDRGHDRSEVAPARARSRRGDGSAARVAEHDDEVDPELGDCEVETRQRRRSDGVAGDPDHEQVAGRLIEDHRGWHPGVGTREDRRTWLVTWRSVAPTREGGDRVLGPLMTIDQRGPRRPGRLRHGWPFLPGPTQRRCSNARRCHGVAGRSAQGRAA